MGKILTAHDELLSLFYDKTAFILFNLLNKLAAAKWSGSEKEPLLLKELSDMLSSTRAYADMLGRRRVLLRLEKLSKFSEPESPNPIIPNIPFQEAIDDLVSRMPALASSAAEVNEVYRTEHSFALAKSADLNLTERIQKIIAAAMKEGKPVTTASELISRVGDWSYSYADIVYRTNLNTSYHAGQFQIMKSPEVKEILPAFRFVAVGDSDTRPNHLAMDGVVASVDDSIWQRLSPPLGYQCRCTLVTVDAITLKRMGYDPMRMTKARIPAGAFPDSFGFGQNPAINVYGF